MDSGLGTIATVATGACVTETVEMSLFPSTVPVMVAEPGAMAVTIPFASTVATPELLVVQMIVRSVSAFCDASYAMPVSGVFTPGTASMRLGRTVTVTTGVFCTVIAAIPDLPFAFAATCVVPTATPVTTPDEETLAIFES